MGNNIEIGRKGELLAKQYLVSHNYNILNMNYRNKIGEIDIIAMNKDILVFIEVKTRRSLEYGYAYEAVNRRKQEKIISTSLVYLKENGFKDIQLRYDIIEVYLTPKTRINHIDNAFC